MHKITHSLNRVGNWHVNLDEPERGLELHQRALKGFGELGDAVGIAQTLDLLGVALLISGQRQQALDTLGQASAAYRRVDDRGGLASVLATRAHLRCATHVYDVLANAAPASKEALLRSRKRWLSRKRSVRGPLKPTQDANLPPVCRPTARSDRRWRRYGALKRSRRSWSTGPGCRSRMPPLA